MDEATLAAALDRFAVSNANLAETVRQEGAATRAVMERVLDAVAREGPSPVADALHEMGGRLEAMQTSLDANTAAVGGIVELANRRRNGG